VELVFLIITKGAITVLDATRLAPTRVQGRRPYRGSVRVLKVLRFGSRRREQYIKAFCELKGEERTFRLDRIISQSNRSTKEEHSAQK